MKLLEKRQKYLSFFLLLSFIVWMNTATFPVRAQERTPDIHGGLYRPEFIEAFLTVNTDVLNAEISVVEKPALEKAAGANAPARKRRFPWVGVILSLALAGGLIYYFLILKTTLQVDTVPSGAKVYLDGIDTAKVTPCELKPSLGAHTIKASLEGYADVEQEFVVKNGKNSLTIPLDLGTYSILVPAANTNVQREAPCLISWDSTGVGNPVAPVSLTSPKGTGAAAQPMAVTRVDLELFQGENKVADIAKGVANSGSYTWNVPAITPEGHNFKVHIVSPAASESHAFGPAFNLLGFKEDFSDNVADFWIPDSAASWSVAGGYFSGTKTTEKIGSAIYDFFYSETSYTVESRMRWSEFSGSNANAPLFIMLATSKSVTGTSGYLLGYGLDGTVSIYSLINFKFTESPTDPPAETPLPLFSAANAAVNTGVGNWNTLKIVRVGGTYTLFVNGTEAYAFVDSTFNPNYLVLGFLGSGTRTRCDFDYVYMTLNP